MIAARRDDEEGDHREPVERWRVGRSAEMAAGKTPIDHLPAPTVPTGSCGRRRGRDGLTPTDRGREFRMPDYRRRRAGP
jgi:hypothetical protein